MATETGEAASVSPACRDRSTSSSGTDPGGPRSTYLAPDVPELAELVGTAEDALLHLATEPGDGDTDVGFGEPDRWWTWVGLAALGAAGCPIPPAGSAHTPEGDREALVALRRLRRALAPALHHDPADARPLWRGPDGGRLVAFRVVVLDHATLDDLTAAARRLRAGHRDPGTASGARDALDCLLAVLVPVDDPDPALLAAAAGAGSAVEVLLDELAHRAHRRVAARLLRALRRLGEPEPAGGRTAPRDREDDR